DLDAPVRGLYGRRAYDAVYPRRGAPAYNYRKAFSRFPFRVRHSSSPEMNSLNYTGARPSGHSRGAAVSMIKSPVASDNPEPAPDEKSHEYEPGDESADVRPERDPAYIRCPSERAHAAQELYYEPYEYEYRGRDVYELYEEKY